jgi:tetrahydromethanopterin S-methyltransferase subunit D
MRIPHLLRTGLLSAMALAGALRCLALQDDGASNAAGAAGCFACSGFLIFIVIAAIAINVAILVWVARDAKARGMDSAVLWMLLVFFLGLIGLVIYLLARPQGNMVPCPNCGNKKLQASVKCPHCGAGS